MRIKQAVVVEGTYDKIKLSEALNAMVITTDGFDIMHNTEKLDYIRKLAKTCGIVVLTDSDRAGFMIRNFRRGVYIRYCLHPFRHLKIQKTDVPKGSSAKLLLRRSWV